MTAEMPAGAAGWHRASSEEQAGQAMGGGGRGCGSCPFQLDRQWAEVGRGCASCCCHF